ncbi:MAG: ATP-binding cassette domain-containing protein [Rickettsiales bacterium]|jgi:Fe-S cluster assembly ATP-binding protein|nr:ATP-binding cassette domain-containing protein [Rickettsiales bacterium]
MLSIKNMSVGLKDNSPIIKNFSLEVSDNAIVIVRGKNGAGKSTLAAAIMNDPRLVISAYEIKFDGRDISTDTTTTRALNGIYFAAQNVPEIPGLTLSSFLKHSMNARHKFINKQEISSADFFNKLNAARARLDIPESWLARSVNVGFSGGEKKRIALLGLILSEPKLAILDEIEAGADAGLQQLIADVINEMHAAGTAFLIISHQEGFIKMLDNARVVVFE